MISIDFRVKNDKITSVKTYDTCVLNKFCQCCKVKKGSWNTGRNFMCQNSESHSYLGQYI